MRLQGRFPGQAEAGDVQPFHFHLHLVDVIASALFVQRVEQHTLLHGRQRVEVGDRADGQWQAIQACLVDIRQRKVRRRQPTIPLFATVRNQCLEF